MWVLRGHLGYRTSSPSQAFRQHRPNWHLYCNLTGIWVITSPKFLTHRNCEIMSAYWLYHKGLRSLHSNRLLIYYLNAASLMSQWVKTLPAMQKTQNMKVFVPESGRPPWRRKWQHSILTWKVYEVTRVRHNWATKHNYLYKIMMKIHWFSVMNYREIKFKKEGI